MGAAKKKTHNKCNRNIPMLEVDDTPIENSEVKKAVGASCSYGYSTQSNGIYSGMSGSIHLGPSQSLYEVGAVIKGSSQSWIHQYGEWHGVRGYTGSTGIACGPTGMTGMIEIKDQPETVFFYDAGFPDRFTISFTDNHQKLLFSNGVEYALMGYTDKTFIKTDDSLIAIKLCYVNIILEKSNGTKNKLYSSVANKIHYDNNEFTHIGISKIDGCPVYVGINNGNACFFKIKIENNPSPLIFTTTDIKEYSRYIAKTISGDDYIEPATGLIDPNDEYAKYVADHVSKSVAYSDYLADALSQRIQNVNQQDLTEIEMEPKKFFLFVIINSIIGLLTNVINNLTNFNKNKDKLTINMSEPNKVIQPAPVPDKRDLILQASQDRITKLKVFEGFFKLNTITDIVDQCKVIHEMFNTNDKINIGKLEQFHYYYTDNFILLLQKIKRSKEENIIILNEQAKVISEKITKTDDLEKEIRAYNNRKKVYAGNLSMIFVNMFNALSHKTASSIFKCNNMVLLESDIYFHVQNGLNNYINLPVEVLNSITSETRNYYTIQGFDIERKVLGKLNNNRYEIEYIEGFNCNNEIVELFKIKYSEEYFIFHTGKMAFMLVKYNELFQYVEDHRNKQKNQKDDLIEKKNKLVLDAANMKYITDPKLLETISTYLTKIKNENFLNDSSDIDLEVTNLTSMMNIEKYDLGK